MKKIITALMLSITLTGCTATDDFMSEVNSIKESFQNDMKAGVKTTKYRGDDGNVKVLSNVMSDLNARRDAELKAINKKIHDREFQIAKIVIDTNLTSSQKKAKTSLLQNEINDLKQQKDAVEWKYKQKFRNFQFD